MWGAFKGNNFKLLLNNSKTVLSRENVSSAKLKLHFFLEQTVCTFQEMENHRLLNINVLTVKNNVYLQTQRLEKY